MAALRAIVADPATDLFATIPNTPGHTILREVRIVGEHNAYHVGEFAVPAPGHGHVAGGPGGLAARATMEACGWRASAIRATIDSMPGPVRSRSTVRLTLAAALAALLLAGRLAAPATDVDALSRWTGGIDLYRSGVFTTQKTWLWCTAADVQIIRNIADRATDHSKVVASSATSTTCAPTTGTRSRSRTGSIRPGWAAGLRRYVDSRYQLTRSGSFDSALRSAVTNLRRTNLPVAITVSHGNHAWVLTGFTATADPAVTTRFTVTSVRVVGPLWGLQSRSYGYDMRPDTKLTPAPAQGLLHAVALRGRPDGLGGSMGVGPAGGEGGPAGARDSRGPPPNRPPNRRRRPTPRPTPSPTATPVASQAVLEPATPSPSAIDALAGVAGPVASADPVAEAAATAPSAPAGDGLPTAVLAGAAVALVVLSVAAAGGTRRVRQRR